VREGVHLLDAEVGDQRQAVQGVDPGGLEELLAQRPVEPGRDRGEVQSGPVDHPADERVPVGVQPGGRHRHDGVPGTDPLGAQYRVGLDDPDGGGSEVVLVGVHQVAVLGGLAAHQRGSGLGAPGRDPGDDRGDPLGHHAAAGDVVLEEQRLGTAGDQVVDDHGHQVDADRVVPVQRPGEGDLGTDAVGRGGEQRTAVLRGVEREQTGEATEPADHLRPVGLLHRRPHQRHRPLAGVDVDAGGGVGQVTGGGRRLGHGRARASSAPPVTAGLPAC
jgi:hypothetical protein